MWASVDSMDRSFDNIWFALLFFGFVSKIETIGYFGFREIKLLDFMFRKRYK